MTQNDSAPIYFRIPHPYLQLLGVVSVQLAILGLVPPPIVQQSLNILFSLWLAGATGTLTRRRWDFWFLAIVGCLPALLELALLGGSTPLELQIFKEVLWILFPFYLGLRILGPILSIDAASHHELAGAVAVYLLIGIGFSDIFEILYQLDPANLQFSQTAFGEVPVFTDFLYFSFVTLATLGYGDVIPVHPLARLTSVLEALTGLLFVSILVGRTVGLHIAGRMPKTQSPTIRAGEPSTGGPSPPGDSSG